MEDTILNEPYPFKFHAQCLLEKDFNVLVKNSWTDQKYNQESYCQRRFIWKLKDLKLSNKRWAKEKKATDSASLKSLEGSINLILQRTEGDRLSQAAETNFIYLESERNKLLKEQEEW
jgi:hypothetical protein